MLEGRILGYRVMKNGPQPFHHDLAAANQDCQGPKKWTPLKPKVSREGTPGCVHFQYPVLSAARQSCVKPARTFSIPLASSKADTHL